MSRTLLPSGSLSPLNRVLHPSRRDLGKAGIAALGPLLVPRAARAQTMNPAGLASPASIYINWGAYDELSDAVPLTEKLALMQLDELLRLRKLGMRFDYYLMDCFWFDQQGSYRTFDKKKFPRGGDAWITRCRQNNIKPGLWLGTNSTWGNNPKPVLQAWKDSHDPRINALSLASGGYLDDLMATLQGWYDRGIRLFKFDFAAFAAAPEELRQSMTPTEISAMNAFALQAALGRFRRRNPEVVTLAYNGFVSDLDNTFAPPSRGWDQRWLRVFDAVYCGDPRFSDVPMWNLWRSMDLYSDHMVRRFHNDDIPLDRIDSSSVMIAKTGTGYHRGKQAYRGMAVLALSRGGRANTLYGNLELLDKDDAVFLARAQRLFMPLQGLGQTVAFGGLPGEAKGAYGFVNLDGAGAVYTVVNPTQSVQTATLPLVSQFQAPLEGARILFRDAGFTPTVSANQLTLGPEQMTVVAFGRYAAESYELGLEPDVIIPSAIESLNAISSKTAERAAQTQITLPAGRDLRVFVLQTDAKGRPVRSSGGSPPLGKPVSDIIALEAVQLDKPLSIEVHHDRVVYSGFSWAAAGIPATKLLPGKPVVVRARSTDDKVANLQFRAYSVKPAT